MTVREMLAVLRRLPFFPEMLHWRDAEKHREMIQPPMNAD
jgi:hypothetical protein